MYDECFLDNKLIMDQKLHKSLQSCSKFGDVFISGNPEPNLPSETVDSQIVIK